jgi:hypothetical protein
MAKIQKEKRIEELSKLPVAELAEKLIDAEAANEKANNDKTALEKQLAEEKKAHIKTKGSLDSALELNDELQEKAEKAGSDKLPVVKINKEKYQVTMPAFRFQGNVYKAAQLEKDPELCQKLLEEGSGVLRLIGE